MFIDIFNNAQDAIFDITLDGDIAGVNAGVEKIFGYLPSDLVGKPFTKLLTEEKQKEFEGIRDNLLLGEKTEPFETERKNASGEYFKVSVAYSVIRDPGGKIRGISSIERKASQFRTVADRSQALLETAPDAMVIVNSFGQIVLINAQTEHLFGYTRKELLGREIEILIPSRFLGKHEENRKRFFSYPKTRIMGVGLELFGKRKNGTEFPVEISLSPLETEEGLLVSAAIRDITDKKLMEKEIRDVNVTLEKKVTSRTAELERKNKELEQFAYVASHDLQEPLRTISSFVELLRSRYLGKLEGDADKYLEFISQSSYRMKTLIKDLLDYSRIGRKITLEQIDCEKLLQDVIADLSKTIQDTGASINSMGLPVIQGYKTEFKLLFQNLVSNSIKFRNAGRKPEIIVSAERKGDQWLFAVVDNGIGIEADFTEQIFVIFQRLHTRSEYEGSGIGLSHCKKIVELHGGKIWVESRPGVGSTFYFTINDL
jgi:PAS domain S-box-containing protein